MESASERRSPHLELHRPAVRVKLGTAHLTPARMPTEFDLIRRHFMLPTRHTRLGVGDDAALLAPRAGMELVVTTDMLVSGTHFFADTDPTDLGWKTLAVNVSDIAAMGAEPRWAFLAIALPAADESWIARLAKGFGDCAQRFGIDLAGGDTTRGPLTLSVTMIGEVPAGQAVRRDGARADDDIWVTGTPGMAALGLAHLLGQRLQHPDAIARALAALQRPQPRVEAGLALRGLATAMLDISDGLLGDLTHILERSACGAELTLEMLPLAPVLATGTPSNSALQVLLTGGDDYELLFTAPRLERNTVCELSQRLSLPFTRIGRITPARGQLRLLEAGCERALPVALGYDHFQS